MKKNTNKEEVFNNPIAILIFIFLIAVGGYFLFNSKDSNNNQVENISSDTQQDQIDPLKKEIGDSKNQQLSPSSTTTTDISTYLTGVVAIHCGIDDNSWNIWSGSGSLWNMDETFYVLTNKHVIGNQVS